MNRSTPVRGATRPVLQRLLRWLVIGVVALYVAGVAGGYLFLRFGRGFAEVRVLDVALFRAAAIRRTMAQQHFRQAKAAWDAKDVQQAYVFYTSAVTRDPDNRAGRLEAARFLESLGATNLEITVLEDGLARDPADREFNEMLFTRLIATARHRHALDLLHGSHAAALKGPNALFLKTVELQATLAVSGAAAARALVDQSPELRTAPKALVLVSRVLWEAGDREAAVDLLTQHTRNNARDAAARALLATWLRDVGREQQALEVIAQAVRDFPSEPAIRVALLDVGAGRIRGHPEWWGEIAGYLRDFNASSVAVFLLAETAGRRGWLEVSRTLYELGARRGYDLGLLALFYSDALMRNDGSAEARGVLEELEQQCGDRNAAFLLQLRPREIAAAATVQDREGVREYARRLAGMLRNSPEVMDQYRSFYQQQGLKEAVAELSAPARSGSPAGTPPRPRGT